jgi:hypothetical protein
MTYVVLRKYVVVINAAYHSGQSKMDNPEKLATYGTQFKSNKNKTNAQTNMCWTPLYANKNK